MQLLLAKVAELSAKLEKVTGTKTGAGVLFPPKPDANGHWFFLIPAALSKGSAGDVIVAGSKSAADLEEAATTFFLDNEKKFVIQLRR